MRQHNKSKTNDVKTRPEAPKKHQATIQAKKAAAKARIAAVEEAAAAYKAQRTAFLAGPPKPPTGYEEFVDRPPRKAKVASRAQARLSKYAVEA
jgi:hypothetical protein